jgi:hypothetical protein
MRERVTKSNSELHHLLTRANRLASRLNGERELERLVGRLARDPDDLDVLPGVVGAHLHPGIRRRVYNASREAE